MKQAFSRLFVFCVVAIVGCQKMGCQKNEITKYTLSEPSFNATAAEIDSICKEEQERLAQALEKIGSLAEQSTFATAVLGMELAMTQMQQNLTPLIFMKYVSDQPALRQAADKCESAVDQMRVEIFAREDLYKALKNAQARKESLSAEDQKLMSEFVLAFQRNGLELSAEDRKTFVQKRKRIVELESEFGKELIEWNDGVEFTREELEGMPESFIQRLKRTPSGKYRVTVQYPDYYPFMENAKNAGARMKLEERFYMRGGQKNKERMDEVLRLRFETAQMLGFANHAAYVLDDRMAKNPETVATFLDRVGNRLKKLGTEELAALLQAKRDDLKDATIQHVHSHDWRFYDNLIKKQKHQIDMQAIKEYFPLEVVNRGMFEIYETLLGVQFVEDKTLPVWHPAVQGFRVTRAGQTIAIFYMDLFPREGKYGHAAAFTLLQGRLLEDGSYQVPISSIVANFNPPADGKPSLLEHGEVKTHFHEFGHIMHQVLTTARYASFSGTSVKRDFVEAPSQMLENWVWDTSALSKLSGHYLDNRKKLPEDQIQRLVDAKLLNVGIRYLRQLLFATLDQQYHGAPPADTTAVYAQLARDIMLIPIPENTIPQAGFGHLMGGYDAGYYGYLWSEVYAQDMFTRFEKEGLLNPKVGADYLKWILQPGGELEPMELIQGFLGRQPNENAFFKSLGLGD